MARRGMTLSDEQVEALAQLFQTLDRGGDPAVLMRGGEVRRFRASIARIRAGKRLRFGGWQKLQEPQ